MDEAKKKKKKGFNKAGSYLIRKENKYGQLDQAFDHLKKPKKKG
jgi:hypothetical protein